MHYFHGSSSALPRRRSDLPSYFSRRVMVGPNLRKQQHNDVQEHMVKKDNHKSRQVPDNSAITAQSISTQTKNNKSLASGNASIRRYSDSMPTKNQESAGGESDDDAAKSDEDNADSDMDDAKTDEDAESKCSSYLSSVNGSEEEYAAEQRRLQREMDGEDRQYEKGRLEAQVYHRKKEKEVQKAYEALEKAIKKGKSIPSDP